MGNLISLALCSLIALTAAETCNVAPSSALPINNNVLNKITLPTGRIFYISLPVYYDNYHPFPAYFSFHGGGKNASAQAALSQLHHPYYNPYGIVIYPEGVERTAGTGKRYWLSHPGIPQASPNDIDFFLDIIKWLDSNVCYDPARVYATGKSNGGGFVNLLACNATSSRKLAAVATVSGAYYMDKLAKACRLNSGQRLPFLSFHGLNDTTIPYDGKVGTDGDDGDTDPDDFKSTYGIDDWLKSWLALNGVDAIKSQNTSFYNGDVIAADWHSTTSKYKRVVHYKENNLGHVWASLWPNLDCPGPIATKCPQGHYYYNATNMILDFFKVYTNPAMSAKDPGPKATGAASC